MRLYLDASALVAALTQDSHSERAAKTIADLGSELVVSDWARAEFVSVVARLVRAGEMSRTVAATTFATLDRWCATRTERTALHGDDVALAETLMRRLDLTLRAPDALHLACVRRTGSTLLTFDTKMAEAARVLGLPVVP